MAKHGSRFRWGKIVYSLSSGHNVKEKPLILKNIRYCTEKLYVKNLRSG
jgi:hypothetical protein